MKQNRPPSEGLQFFGTLHASAKTRGLTVTLRNLEGQQLYKVELPPAAS
jgi:alkaline phosphatase D